jgi:uncharacterized glyoxalase superfamily metalloenzyme YdcJ
MTLADQAVMSRELPGRTLIWNQRHLRRALGESGEFCTSGNRTAPSPSAPCGVRSGEVGARGIALTAAGRARYDDLTARTDRALAEDPALIGQEAAEAVWMRHFPCSEPELAGQDLGFSPITRSAGRRTASDHRETSPGFPAAGG